MYVTVRMVQHFSAISSTDDRPWLEFYTLALCSKNGVLVSLTPAKD